MRNLFTILFLATILSCTKTNNTDKTKSDKLGTLTTIDKITLDSLDFNVIKFDTSTIQYIFPTTYGPTDLSDKEIIECERLLKSYIADYNEKAIKRFNEITKKYPAQKFNPKDFTIELKDYGRQYIAVVSDKGEKIAYVNCFCDPARFNYRDKELVEVMDGGNCYFEFKVDLKKNEIFDFAVNGWS